VGIHNTLEAAIFGMPVFFGPNYHKFNEANAMVKLGIAVSISNFTTLESSMNAILFDTEKRKTIAQSCAKYTNENIGATNQILDKVFNNF